LGRRTLRLYLYHAVLLSLVFLMAVPITASGKHPGLHNLLDFFFSAGPVRAAMDAALLVYRPPLLDILPMYIIFLVLTPLALRMGQKLGWTVTLSSGFAIWLMAQLGLRQTAWGLLNRHFGLRIPLNEMGSFDPWAWQLVWLVGLWMGVCWAKDELPLTRVASKVASPALIVVLALLTMRYASFRGFDLGRYAIYVDKWHLGVVRLINFSAPGGPSHLCALVSKAALDSAPSTPRPVVAPGLLHAPGFLFCWHHATRWCFDVERLEAIRTCGDCATCHVAYSQTVR
jgi:hypothetical protein